MQRRSFVKSAIIGSAATAMVPARVKGAAKKSAAEYYELRVYQLKDEAQQKLVEDFLKNAAIPVLSRLGIKHVGVFTEMKPTGQTKLFVLIQYNSIDHFNAVTEQMANDAELLSKGAAYLNAPAKQPAYDRIESSLLKAFTHMPSLIAPEKKTRIMELRQYQSASEEAGKRKIDMFNNQGEINIFKRLGFNPVFWGETIIGIQRPNLTYMLTFDDMAAKDAHWKAFGGDPEWKKIRSIPENADALLVSKITSTLLIPTEYSQI
ncbi:MAG: NIPSNAP family protein [Mucilaginibacter sp.]